MLDIPPQSEIEAITHKKQITLNANERGRAVAMLDTPPNPHPKMQALFDRGFINEF